MGRFSSVVVLARLDAVKHRRSFASALLTLFLLEIERFADAELHFTELTLGSRVVASRRGFVLDHVLLAGAAPSDWATIVVFVVHRNAALNYAAGVAQRDSAVDLVAMLILLDLNRAVEVFRTVALVAMLLRIHFLTFTIRLVFELACRQLVSFVI